MAANEMASRRVIKGRAMGESRYTRTARIVHWTIAGLIPVQVTLGFIVDKAGKPLGRLILDQHVRIGLLILLLMLLRAAWRVANPPPPLPEKMPVWQRWTAATVHRAIYLLLIVLPVSGYVLWAWIGLPLDWWGLFPVPILFEGGDDERWRSIAGYTHEYAGYLLIALIALHVGAALWHEFVAKDRLISQRML